MGEWVKLTDSECQVAKLVGQLRRQWHLNKHSTTTQHWTPDAVDRDDEAVAAELAVAKMFNVYPPLAIVMDAPQHDLIIGPHQVDVKSVKKRPGVQTHLLIPYLKEHLVYLSVEADMPNYEVRGYLFGWEVAERGEWVDLGHHFCWRVHPVKLRDVMQLAIKEACTP